MNNRDKKKEIISEQKLHIIDQNMPIRPAGIVIRKDI